MMTLPSLVFFLMALQLGFAAPISGCKQPKKFYLSVDKANFFQAFINCKNGGMELAAIENEEQSNALDAFLDPHKLEGWGNGIWLSGTNLNQVNSWQYYWLSNGKRAVYTNWIANPPQPDNSLGKQHNLMWVLWQGNTGWADESAEAVLRYVCEYNA